MTDRPLALIGGAHVHLPDHLEHIDRKGWRISHVIDRDTARRKRLADALGATAISHDDLAQSGCRGAVVCSETIHHEDDIRAALEADLPVFTEKPLAGSAEAATRCAELAQRKGLLLHTGYFFRTNPALQRLHGLLRTDALGRIAEARMRFSHDGGFADWLDLDCWMTEPELACYGGFADEAVHAIDALQWLLGPASSSRAATGNHLGWPVDDHGAALLHFDTGATGVVEGGWTDHAMRLELDLVGDKGWATVRDGVLRAFKRGASTAFIEAELSSLDAGDGIDPFLEAIDGREASGLVPAADAARVNALLDQMWLRLV